MDFLMMNKAFWGRMKIRGLNMNLFLAMIINMPVNSGNKWQFCHKKVVRKHEKLILQAGKSREEGIVFENQLTDLEKEDAYYGWLEKYVAKMLNRTCKTLECEVDINHSEGKIVGVGIDVAVSEESVGSDALKTDISDCISKALNVTEDSIAVSVHQ